MLGFGILIGPVFLFVVVALGVPRDIALRPSFFVATLIAGLVFAEVNHLLARAVFGVRLRILAGGMKRVEASLGEASHSGERTGCDPAAGSVPVDSTHELGGVAASFKPLVAGLSTGHQVSDGIPVDRPGAVGGRSPITPSGGHCWFLGGEADGVEAVRRSRDHGARGVDLIKVMVTGGEISPGGVPYLSQYRPEELCAIAEEAHGLGLRVSGHAHGAPGIADAVAAGFDGIEPAALMTAVGVHRDLDLFNVMAARRVFVSVPVASTAAQPFAASRGYRRPLNPAD